MFGNTDNSLLIIGFKGTTAGVFSGEPTGEKDKLNVSPVYIYIKKTTKKRD